MTPRSELAVPHGADADELRRVLDGARTRFVCTGAAGPAVRPVVADSWRRSLASGVDPEVGLAPIRADETQLHDLRAMHPLTPLMPLIRRLLVEDAAEAGLLTAVSDASGQLLYVEGASHLRARAEPMHFVAGTDWSEASAGTNAPGTALALGRPVQIYGFEHLSSRATAWSCAAAPIRDPDTGRVLGVLDVTGGPDVAAPHALSLVRAAAAAAEAQLRLTRLGEAGRPRRRQAVAPAPHLEVLGRAGGVLTHGSTRTRLSLRHSEILVLLARTEEGLSTGQVAVALSEGEQAAVTVRAEISRLRHLLGPVVLDSRPYRLRSPLSTDADEVGRALRAGDVRRAVAHYRGPVLPESCAPAVTEQRDELHAMVRSALLASTDVQPVLAYVDAPHGSQDYELWRHASRLLPHHSPRRHQVVEHLAHLDTLLG